MNKKRIKKSSLQSFSIMAIAFIISLTSLSKVEASKDITKAKASGNDKLSITFDEVPDNYEKIGSIYDPEGMTIWRYSNGLWGYNTERVKVKNENLEHLEMSFNGLKNGKVRSHKYPEEVNKALAEGKEVIVRMNIHSAWADKLVLDEILKNVDNPEKLEFKDGGDTFSYRTYPKFHFQQNSLGSTLVLHQDFGLDIGAYIPFVKEHHGNNGYSMYGLNGRSPNGRGAFTPWMGDKQIPIKTIKSDGTLQPGYSVNLVDNTTHKSENIRIGSSKSVFNSGGAFGFSFRFPYEFNFYIVEDKEEDIILTDLKLYEKDEDGNIGKEIGHFKRELDSLNALSPSKEKITGKGIKLEDAIPIKRNKDYHIEAKYIFVSYKEGEFDITKPETMTEEQRELNTEIDRNRLVIEEFFDENIETKKANYKGIKDGDTKPNTRLYNLEEETFSWDFNVKSEAKEKIQITGRVPGDLFPKEKNQNQGNDGGSVFVEVEGNDMSLYNLRLLDEDGKSVTKFEKGKKYTADVVVKHESGEDTIGLDPEKNPKPSIFYKAGEPNKIILPDNPKQTKDVLEPEKSLRVPESNTFTVAPDSDANIIRVCAFIDGKHKKLGYNDDTSNDKVCKDFTLGGDTDMGLLDLKLYDEHGKEVNYIEPNKNYTADVVARHVFGDKVIGEHPQKNPKVSVYYKVMELGSKEIYYTRKQATELLHPGKEIKVPKTGAFSSDQGIIKVCAKINEGHRALGYNIDPSNDMVCREYGMGRNYFVSNLRASPASVTFPKGQSQMNKHPVTLLFKVGNETMKGAPKNLPSLVPVEIKQNGKVVWRKNLSVAPGEVKNFSVSILTTLTRGNNTFTVEANPKRLQKEFKPGVSNPYADNKKTVNINGVENAKCQECDTRRMRTSNSWTERWEWEEQRGVVKSSYYTLCNSYDSKGSCTGYTHYPYEYCQVTYSKKWHEDIKYSENFKISEVRFGSKLNEDTTGSRMLSIPKNGEARIKAGYGFDLEIDTTYKTNRGVAPLPAPKEGNPYRGDSRGRYSSGYCDFITRYPGVTPVNAPKVLYVEMPYTDKTGRNVCYILTEYVDKGNWDNLTRTFKLPLRSSPSGTQTRRVYSGLDTRPNNKTEAEKKSRPIKIVTPRPNLSTGFYGYVPENQVGQGKGEGLNYYLHDCHTIYVVILHNDDIKTHIAQ